MLSTRPRDVLSKLHSDKASLLSINQGKKVRENLIGRKSFQPHSSSVMKDKRLPNREDRQKLNSKLELIRAKCMKGKVKKRSDSTSTLKSEWMSNQSIHDSCDVDSEDGTNNTSSTFKTKQVSFIKSPYEDRPATILFKYPKCCGIENVESDRIFTLEKANLTYKIYGSEYRCIVNALEFNGFTACEEGSDWLVLFDISGTHMKVLEQMNKHQKINHFPGCWNLGRKDSMWRHLHKQRRTHTEAYNFVPVTYIFPSDFDRFEMARENADKNQLWIMKPANQACGRGIKMLTKDTKIKNKKETIVSEYIANPHLINNYKYDLRIYVLVSSYDPLRIYMLDEGLTRFATYEYNAKLKDIKKRFIHLTNFSVNKHSKKFVKNSKAEVDGQGSKWSITALKKWYQLHGIDSEKIFAGIKDIIIKTCIAAEPVMLDIHSKTQQKRNCGFQIYGFDILIDQKLKPWLMEVNVCPSLSSSSPMDRKIKHTLLVDTLNILGLQHVSRKTYQLQKKREKERLLHHRQNKKYYARNVNNLEELNYNNCVDILSPDDWQVLFTSQEEFIRKGNFQRIFPVKETIDQYSKLFEYKRYNNHVLWKYVKSGRDFLERLYQ